MEKVKRRCPVFVIEILSSFFVRNMKPNLDKEKTIFMHLKGKSAYDETHFLEITNLTKKM